MPVPGLGPAGGSTRETGPQPGVPAARQEGSKGGTEYRDRWKGEGLAQSGRASPLRKNGKGFVEEVVLKAG